MKKRLITFALFSLTIQTVLANDYSKYSPTKIQINADGTVGEQKLISGRDNVKHEYKFVEENKAQKSKIVQELKIDHEDKAISRITHRSYEKQKDGDDDVSKSENLITYSLNKEGKPTSITDCSKENTIMYVGKTMRCVTINKGLCDYLKTPSVSTLLISEIKACTDTIERVKKHQLEMARLTQNDYENDIGAISKMNGRLSKEKSIFNIDVDSVSSLSHISNATGEAMIHCQGEHAKELQISLQEDKTEDKNKKGFFSKITKPFKKINVPFVNDKPNASNQ